MPEQRDEPEPMTQEELEQQEARLLDEREAMSILPINPTEPPRVPVPPAEAE
jgi:hypothetical protein